ncbi:TorF family putative porin [Hansschlegelia plantiphila]|uniref:Uncharacterized protein n=1 Tax=Hansschlegelia plantiphila TaxID=374655 RepID=A0A9W6J4T8_9HYPH|nr:TorF family putative porin [Hansschlegelia plantiphila]GLK69753.1 hypothetical protein GCM10008179_33910 [Hansschlegelia plantiphila]
MSGALRSALAAAAISVVAMASPAAAADLAVSEPPQVATPDWFDAAFGVTLASQYAWRGLAQSDGHPGLQGYGEFRFFDWVYAGAWLASVDFPTSKGLTDPAVEADLYFGVRHTWDRFTFDAGAIYFYYAGEKGGNIDFWEPYLNPSYKVNDWLTLNALLRVTDNFVNKGAKQAYFLGTAKISLPNYTPWQDINYYVTASLGKRWVGKTDDGFNFPNYVVWQGSVGATYKAATLDFRYSKTDLSRRSCALFTGDSGWCGSKYVLSLSFDTTLSALK